MRLVGAAAVGVADVVDGRDGQLLAVGEHGRDGCKRAAVTARSRRTSVPGSALRFGSCENRK